MLVFFGGYLFVFFFGFLLSFIRDRIFFVSDIMVLWLILGVILLMFLFGRKFELVLLGVEFFMFELFFLIEVFFIFELLR